VRAVADLEASTNYGVVGVSEMDAIMGHVNA
jgi:hypothetical protein